MIVKAVIIWYLILNVAMFLAMGIDKYKAMHNKWRIPEATLFAIAYLGGFAGSFGGMYFFHHKTKKWYFHLHFTLSAIINIVIIYFIIKNLQ